MFRYLFLLFILLIATAGTIDLLHLFDYEDATGLPAYVQNDNQPNQNPVTDAGATLGRVLFYDKQLSLDGTVSCGSCHQQAFAFGDTARVSTGLSGGTTARHSMRLAYARFSPESRMFWDERAATLEQQVLQPVQDHVEMGWSGENGQPGLDSLRNRLAQLDYYQELFDFVYDDPEVTPQRMRRALAQFVRSLRSFDSKYDRAVVQNGGGNFAQPFALFTPQENLGKALFHNPPNGGPGGGPGGAGCLGCHVPPEFGMVVNSQNNGVLGVANDPGALDLTNTRSPSLRDVARLDGSENGPYMHDGSLVTLLDVVQHYDSIHFDISENPQLDPRLRGGPGGNGQRLNLSQEQQAALVAFLKTLSSEALYTDEKFSDPFDPNGNLDVVGLVGTQAARPADVGATLSPNPTNGWVSLSVDAPGMYQVRLLDVRGRAELLTTEWLHTGTTFDLNPYPTGTYWLELTRATGTRAVVPLVKQ